MKMFLLVSVVALLVSPAVSNPTHHRQKGNTIIDLALEYNKTLNQQIYVQDLSHLTVACEDKFFCKAHDILHKHEIFGKSKEEKEIVRNLKNYTRGNCTELVKGVTSTGIQTPVPTLLGNIITCIQKRNMENTTSNA